MNVDLHYGSGIVSVDVPKPNVAQIITPASRHTSQTNQEILQSVFAGKTAERLANEFTAKRIAVLTSDGSRDIPLADVLPGVCRMLSGCQSVLFMICTGTHEPDTKENDDVKSQILCNADKEELANYDIHVHDCRQAEFIRAGRTSRGSEVVYNKLLADMDAYLVLSDIKCHYFAGYSNPVKNFVPGVCDYETARMNHSFALNKLSAFGTHPWHRNENRRGNPLADDQLEGVRMIVGDKEVHSLVTVSNSGEIQWAGLGQAKQVCGECFDVVDKLNTRTVAPSEYLIVSPGGLPNDVDLYISQRALELTKAAVADGGEVLFVSACPKGIGEKNTLANFYDLLAKPLDEVFTCIQGDYRLFSHKSYKFAEMIDRLAAIWVYSEIPDEVLSRIHLKPANDLQAIVDGWLKQRPDAKITIVDGANKIALYPQA